MGRVLRAESCTGSAPAESRSDGRQNGFHDMGVVFNAELVGDGEQEGVGLGDRLVFPELGDQNIRLRGVTAAEDRACVFFDETDLVAFVAGSTEIETITLVGERKDTAADGDARRTSVTSLLPGGAKDANLGGLLDV